jgi:hypothetical protein
VFRTIVRGFSRGATTFAALSVALILTLAATAQAAPKTFFGVVPQTPLGASDFEKMGQGHVGTLRVPLLWAGVEPTQGGGYNFGGFDPTVEEAARNGITVLPFVYATPGWVARDLDGQNCSDNCATFGPRSAAARDAWGKFLVAAVDRYGPNGTFWADHPSVPKKPIRAWQIWNEQNSKVFWAPKQNPKAYAKLLDASADAINSRDRGADIVLGGMAGLAGSRKATPGPKYLRKLYRRRGVEKDFDGVAVHPYGAKVKAVIEEIDNFRNEITRAHDGRASLWITEMGWSSAKKGNPLNVGKKGQAKRLKQAYKYFLRERKRLNVKTVDWFSWTDSQESICDWCQNAGLLTHSLQEKPAFSAFTRLAK